MQITEYAWIHVLGGEISSVRPNGAPGLTEIGRSDGFASAWNNLQISGWRLSPGQAIPMNADFEIQIERGREYVRPVGRVAEVPVAGSGTFTQNVEAIRLRYEVNGWDLHAVIFSTNVGARMIFTKPEGAPDVQPFVEPSLGE